MTDAELAAAADRLVVTDRPPPMPAADIVADLVWSVSSDLLDLWTLLESLEAEHHPGAITLLPDIAEHLGITVDRLRAVAAAIGARLPPESPLFAD